MISLQPKYLQRYKDIALLLFKYGRSDLVSQSGIDIAVKIEVDETDVDPDRVSPENLAKDLEQMGPAFIKLGQLLSTRPELLPEEYLDALSRLQDDAKPVPWSDIRELLEQQYGAKPSAIFAEIEEKPAATASLGQVHRARLRDGRDVVIKVQRPDLQPSLQEDLHALQELATFLDSNSEFGRKYQVLNLVESLRQSLESELDYQQEARNATLLRKNLACYDALFVPEAIEDLCREKVLVMERVTGAKITKISRVVLLELDGERLAEQLFDAYLNQVLVDGVFHADPHPGNLWLTDDHRVALLDFGLVVRVAPVMRADLLKLLLSVGEADADTAVKVAERTGRKTQHYDKELLYRQVSKIFADIQGESLENISAGRIIMNLQRAACEAGMILPNEITMLGKTLLNLDKTMNLLDARFNPTEAINKNAKRVMRKHSQNRFSWNQVYQTLLETTDLTQQLPARLNEFTRLVSENEVKVSIDAIDEDRLIGGMQKIANRITAGLVIAALILGASILMTIQSEWTLFPWIAGLFMLTSIVLAAILLWQIMWTD